MSNAKKILEFWHLMEKPKLIFRQAGLSTGRKESVADHSWRLSLMAAFLAPQLKKKINLEKTLKMALIHDLGEIKAGDIPSFVHSFNKKIANLKQEQELAAMKEIKQKYSEFGKEIFQLWNEYENQKTFEARFVKALDKLDCRIQIIDDPKTANYSSAKLKKVPELTAKTDKLCAIDPLLVKISELSKKERKNKYGF